MLEAWLLMVAAQATGKLAVPSAELLEFLGEWSEQDASLLDAGEADRDRRGEGQRNESNGDDGIEQDEQRHDGHAQTR